MCYFQTLNIKYIEYSFPLWKELFLGKLKLEETVSMVVGLSSGKMTSFFNVTEAFM